MFGELPTMEQAKRYEQKTKGMSAKGRAILDEMLARATPDPCCQGMYSVSIYDLRDICERISNAPSTRVAGK